MRRAKQGKGKVTVQRELRFGDPRGGAREGAGRPRGKGSDAEHRVRPVHRKAHPVHVVLRLRRDTPKLRKRRAYAAIRQTLVLAAAKQIIGAHEFRVVHASIQQNHLHFIIEALDSLALSRGMQGLATSLARRINRMHRRTGKVFAYRFHATEITSPRQTRSALAYVLNNWHRHREATGRRAVDPFSTGHAFDGWREGPPPPDPEGLPSATPKTWLLTTGWKRHPLISAYEVPTR